MFQAVDELFILLGLFTNQKQSHDNPEAIRSFRTKALALFSTEIDGQSAWTTLIRWVKIVDVILSVFLLYIVCVFCIYCTQES